jgi:hypothetical protein
VLSRASVAPTVHRAASGGGVGSSCFFLTCVFWGKQGTITKRVALTIFYLDSAGFAEFMKADNEDNGKALKSLGLAK